MKKSTATQRPKFSYFHYSYSSKRNCSKGEKQSVVSSTPSFQKQGEQMNIELNKSSQKAARKQKISWTAQSQGLTREQSQGLTREQSQGLTREQSQGLTREQSQKLTREQFVKRYPDILASLEKFALQYQSQGQYRYAEILFLKLFSWRIELLGEKHPRTLESMRRLVELYEHQSKYGEAIQMSLKKLKLMTEILGEKHPDTFKSMSEIAGLYHAQGRYRDAESWYERALELRVKIWGKSPLKIW